MTRTGAPRPARHLCTGITHLRLDDQGGKAWVFIEKERRQAQPKLGGFSSKPAGLALFYRNFFTCQSLDNKALSRCWRVQLPGEAERHWWVSNAKIYILISKSWFSYLRRGTAEVPTFRKLMRPLEWEPPNSTTGLPGVESRAATIWQFFRLTKKFFLKEILYIFMSISFITIFSMWKMN